jgi:hypothetical protein
MVKLIKLVNKQLLTKNKTHTMSNTNNTQSTNLNKRTFLKSLCLSLAFLSFGGFGSIINSFFTKKQEAPKSGFGSNGYGV